MDICLSCGGMVSENANQHILFDRRKGLEGSWRLVECNHCGVVSMIPMPSEEQLANYYNAYSNNQKIDMSKRFGSRYPRLRKLYHLISGDVDPRDFIRVPAGARVLDYGCGHAGYLSDFHDRGIAISGAEIAGYIVEACCDHGYDVHKVDDFSHIPFNDDEFDIVYLMQVFEHLRDPHAFLRELARILKKNGELYLAVPNASSIWRRVFGRNWISGWFAPFHLFHYNKYNLSKIASEHGFDLVNSWSRTPEMWFRLNLKAFFYPKENQLDWKKSWLDARPISLLLMMILRVIELPFLEKDCVVLHLKKCK